MDIDENNDKTGIIKVSDIIGITRDVSNNDRLLKHIKFNVNLRSHQILMECCYKNQKL